jgi:hypothetical protein
MPCALGTTHELDPAERILLRRQLGPVRIAQARLQAAVAVEHIGLHTLAVATALDIAQQGAWLGLFILTAAQRIRIQHSRSPCGISV